MPCGSCVGSVNVARSGPEPRIDSSVGRGNDLLSSSGERSVGLERLGLRRDLEDARKRERATSEVLEALGRSRSDLQAVFETVVENATRLCQADAGAIHVLDGEVYRLAFAVG